MPPLPTSVARSGRQGSGYVAAIAPDDDVEGDAAIAEDQAGGQKGGEEEAEGGDDVKASPALDATSAVGLASAKTSTIFGRKLENDPGDDGLDQTAPLRLDRRVLAGEGRRQAAQPQPHRTRAASRLPQQSRPLGLSGRLALGGSILSHLATTGVASSVDAVGADVEAAGATKSSPAMAANSATVSSKAPGEAMLTL